MAGALILFAPSCSSDKLTTPITPPTDFVVTSDSLVILGGSLPIIVKGSLASLPATSKVTWSTSGRSSHRSGGIRSSILRIPGIYAPDRAGGTPKDRLLKGTPVLQDSDDVYTNHIHADDLARACLAALWRGKPQRIYNVNDDSNLKMGDYFDMAADIYKLPRPPRVPRSTAQDQLPLLLLSFMSESRQMDNSRMKRELRLKLRYPTVAAGLLPPQLF